ncbi:sulfurtransferase TusA family protein [Brevundimonas lenta]|uniref:tRNA 2-thiouridine synthesizing protein A n=1 Tax=Brevundimonas lenta TaxID=424796 RepID=A0A7W6JF14_9CAUL|nr:sulfurtransferase TusA family protein [Brevundimonas lenta]MBB4082932.1 tRNA 2-thiouridine synthesizing protein A [Brevundimonas lenta]
MIVDARGHRCPTPSLKLQKAIHQSGPGERITLLATDPMARIDVPYLMTDLGGRVVEIQEAEGVLTIVVETPGAPTA